MDSMFEIFQMKFKSQWGRHETKTAFHFLSICLCFYSKSTFLYGNGNIVGIIFFLTFTGSGFHDFLNIIHSARVHRDRVNFSVEIPEDSFFMSIPLELISKRTKYHVKAICPQQTG